MNDKITILCVEDGSVDLQSLEENGVKDGQILSYRQGSTPPFVLTLNNNRNYITYEKWEELKEFVNNSNMYGQMRNILRKMEELEYGNGKDD